MRTQNDYLIQKSTFGVLANQISFSKKRSYERKHKNAKIDNPVLSFKFTFHPKPRASVKGQMDTTYKLRAHSCNYDFLLRLPILLRAFGVVNCTTVGKNWFIRKFLQLTCVWEFLIWTAFVNKLWIFVLKFAWRMVRFSSNSNFSLHHLIWTFCWGITEWSTKLCVTCSSSFNFALSSYAQTRYVWLQIYSCKYPVWQCNKGLGHVGWEKLWWFNSSLKRESQPCFLIASCSEDSSIYDFHLSKYT